MYISEEQVKKAFNLETRVFKFQYCYNYLKIFTVSKPPTFLTVFKLQPSHHCYLERKLSSPAYDIEVLPVADGDFALGYVLILIPTNDKYCISKINCVCYNLQRIFLTF
jgi:hypothetical protein